MPTFFVPSDAVAPPVVRITGPLLRHLRDSLRLRPGEALLLTDDHRRRHKTEITQVTPHSLECRILETAELPPRSSPSLVLMQAVLKGDKMDWVVQKSTELGVDCIVPVQTTNTVVKIQQDRTEHQRARWERIALEAAQQSERWTVPAMTAPTDLSQAAAAHPSSHKLMLVERSAESSLTSVPLPDGPDHTIVLLVGPEGGWDGNELLLMREQGYQPLTLGSRILRAETAAIAALSIVQSRLGELG